MAETPVHDRVPLSAHSVRLSITLTICVSNRLLAVVPLRMEIWVPGLNGNAIYERDYLIDVAPWSYRTDPLGIVQEDSDDAASTTSTWLPVGSTAETTAANFGPSGLGTGQVNPTQSGQRDVPGNSQPAESTPPMQFVPAQQPAPQVYNPPLLYTGNNNMTLNLPHQRPPMMGPPSQPGARRIWTQETTRLEEIPAPQVQRDYDPWEQR